MYCIYCYTNKITGKKYVGQTCQTLEERAGKDGSGYKNCSYFFSAIKKYGWENFVGEILEDGLTLEQANEREQYWISQLNTIAPNGFNLAVGGDNHTAHQLTRQKISEAGKGRKQSEHCKEALRKSRLGSHHSEESRRKMSEKQKGKNHNPDRTYQSKPVRQYTKDLELIAEFPSTHEAARQTGIHCGNIGACCNGKYNYAGGFVWVYVGQPLPDIKKFKRSPVRHKIEQLTKDGILVAEYESTADAARQFGCYAACIRRCLIGEVKSYKGFVWKWAA